MIVSGSASLLSEPQGGPVSASRATDGTQPSSSASLLSEPRGGPVSASRVWAARRRSRPMTLSSVRNDAATSISSAASMQEKYNETKLALCRQRHNAKVQQMRIQHAAKMANLALEARLLRKQLGAEEE